MNTLIKCEKKLKTVYQYNDFYKQKLQHKQGNNQLFLTQLLSYFQKCINESERIQK